MNLGAKDLDALLKNWGAPLPGLGGQAPNEQVADQAWNAQARAIMEATVASKKAGSQESFEALLAPPCLIGEPGEPASDSESEVPKAPSAFRVQPRVAHGLRDLAERVRHIQPAPQMAQKSGVPPLRDVGPAHAAATSARPEVPPTPLHAAASAVLAPRVPTLAPSLADESTSRARPSVSVPRWRRNASGAALAAFGLAATIAAFVATRKVAPSITSGRSPTATEIAATPSAPLPEAHAAGPQSSATRADNRSAQVTEVASPGPADAGPLGRDGSRDPRTPGKVATVDRATSGPGEPLLKEGPLDTQAPGPIPAAGGEPGPSRPEQPSQGAVQAALGGTVMSATRACVAGATGLSRAHVTFSSNGSVTNVVVAGWAASNGKRACIQAALKVARVDPFSKPTFMVSVPIRP